MTLVVIAGNQQQVAFPVVGLAPGVTVTGATFTLKRYIDDPDPGVLQKTAPSGGLTIDATGTIVYANLVEADLDWLDLGDTGFFFDLQLMLSDGSGPYTAELGRLRVRRRITQTP
jgi:hypothetical protein